MEETRLNIYNPDDGLSVELPFADAGIKAGFPSPAQDYLTECIDLNQLVIRHKESTFYARVSGDSLRDAGIDDGDIVVIDKMLDAQDGSFVVAFVDGEFTLKRFKKDVSGECAWLMPANDKYKPIKVTADNDFIIWGVLTYALKKLY